MRLFKIEISEDAQLDSEKQSAAAGAKKKNKKKKKIWKKSWIFFVVLKNIPV